MSRIDFPSSGDNHISYDDAGNATYWKKINNSWVKQFDYSEESPAPDGEQYCKLNQVWTPITFPIPTDVSTVPGDTGIETYARQGDAWYQVDLGAAGPAFVETTPGLYGLNQADGLWTLVPNDDLTANYYTAIQSDARFSPIIHDHPNTEITGLGALATEADDPDDGQEYIRKNKAWAVKTEHAKPILSNSVTIIDPIATDDVLLFWTPTAITLSGVHVAIRPVGVGSVFFNILHADTADGSGGDIKQLFDNYKGTTSNVGETILPDTANGATTPNVEAGSYIWVVLDDANPPALGTTMFHCTTVYTED